MTSEPMNSADPHQLGFSFPHHPSYHASDFIVSDGNLPLWRAIDGQEPDGASLFIWGETGVGKSHLASIWAEKRSTKVLPARDLNEAFLVDHHGPLAVDDLDKDLDQIALFHLLNLARERQFSCLLVSGSPLETVEENTKAMTADSLAITLPDLLSRLRALPNYQVKALGDEQLKQLLAKLMADRQFDASPELIDYVLRRIERHPRAIAELVSALDQLSLEKKRSPTRALVAELFK